MDDVVIRPAVETDAAIMSGIYNQAVLRTTATFDTEPETVDARRAWLAGHSSPMHPVFVAEVDGRVVGWSSLSEWSTR